MSRSQIESYLRPLGPNEAWEILGRGDNSVRVVSGGTDLTIACPPEVTTLVDVSRALPASVELHEDELTVGAMATLTEMIEDPHLAGWASGVIAEMLADVGSPLLRNVCTIGGHLARGKLSDVIPVMLALDAEVTIFAGEEERLTLADYYADDRHRAPHLLMSVHLPKLEPPSAAAFQRFARTAYDFPMANCAVRLSGNGEVRIVVGATPQRGQRALTAEEIVRSGERDASTFERAGEAAAGEIPVGSSWVVSGEYRTQLVKVLVRRTLAAASIRLGSS